MAENDKEKAKKQIPLRLSASLYEELARWAEDDFRSINGQIEFLLSECVKRRKKSGKDDNAKVLSAIAELREIVRGEKE